MNDGVMHFAQKQNKIDNLAFVSFKYHLIFPVTSKKAPFTLKKSNQKNIRFFTVFYL